MPGLDGGGPLGRGALTGRGRGFCLKGTRILSQAGHVQKVLYLAALPACAWVIKDLRAPGGVIRSLAAKTGRILPGKGRSLLERLMSKEELPAPFVVTPENDK